MSIKVKSPQKNKDKKSTSVNTKLPDKKTFNIVRLNPGTVHSKIRAIGNSQGVILSNQLLQRAGLAQGADIILTVHDGQIIIMKMNTQKVNTDLSSWEQQFKQAIKEGHAPEKNLLGNISNEFDLNEW